MRRAAVALFLLLVVSTAPVASACQYWQCRESETTATCYMFFCSGSACNDSIYAAQCPVTCDRYLGSGGCWCEPQGMCYDI
jgi:hypothetical protein